MTRGFVAKAFVLVALSSAAVPVFADSDGMGLSIDNSSLYYLSSEAGQSSVQDYWTGSSEYYVANYGASMINASTSRRVLITGWHPVEGFETEIAAEAANRAIHASHL